MQTQSLVRRLREFVGGRASQPGKYVAGVCRVRMGRYKKHVNILFNWLRFPDGHRIGGKNVSHIIITGSELDNANPVWDDGRLLLTLNEGQKVVFARPGDRRRMPEHLPQA